MPDPWASLALENICFSPLRAKLRIWQLENWPPCWSRRCIETGNYYIFKTFIFHVFFNLFLKALKCQIRGFTWRRKIFTSALYEQNSGFDNWKTGRRSCQGDAQRLEITFNLKHLFFTFFQFVFKSAEMPDPWASLAPKNIRLSSIRAKLTIW